MCIRLSNILDQVWRFAPAQVLEVNTQRLTLSALTYDRKHEKITRSPLYTRVQNRIEDPFRGSSRIQEKTEDVSDMNKLSQNW